MYALYKYRLHELFIAQFGKNRQAAKRDFCSRYGWDMRTIENDFSIQIDAPASIPAARLQQYAQFLNTSIENFRTKKQAA